ncbi:M48 family metallopeptidase [bacterium]|nr:M48 family metallopeptidase [bacterium]
MKKILIAIFALFLGLSVNAATTTTTPTSNWDSAAAQSKLNNIAYKIIKANSLPDGISIKVSDSNEANAYASINKEIYVYRGLLNYATTDEEIAAVISHEMGHIINGHNAKQSILNTLIANVTGDSSKSVGAAAVQELSSAKLSRKDEFEADLSGVDLLVKAGYNPLAMISVLNKICGNYIDIISSHPSGEKRLMNVYDYVSYNYPDLAKKGYNSDSYKKAYALISLNVEERKASQKLTKKYEKQQEKLKKEKIKRAKKMLKANNGWNSAYNTLLLLNSTESSTTQTQQQ